MNKQSTKIWSVPRITAQHAQVIIGGLLVMSLVLTIFTSGLFAFLAFFAFLALVYARFIEPNRLTITQKQLSTALPKLRIGVLADLHVGPFKKKEWVAKTVHAMNELKPDLIVLPGDFLFDHTASLDDLEPLHELHAPLGVFAVAGNHDAGHYVDHHGAWTADHDRTAELEAWLTKRGITMLRNRSIILESFAIAGIDDLWGASCDIDAAFHTIPDNLPVLFLTHHPDTILDPRLARAALVICGHTHGGQVRIPGYGPLGVPTVLGTKYAYGLFTFFDQTKLFVTRGTGETLLPIRFCCPPEIALLECSTER